MVGGMRGMILALVVVAASGGAARAQDRVSSFGQYRGYSPRSFDSFVREARYVPVADGTRIAIDIYRPAVAGRAADQPAPVALLVTRYWRSSELEDGSIRTMAGIVPAGRNWAPLLDPAEYRSERGWAVITGELLRHGYVVVTMDSRGTGASFGTQTPLLTRESTDMREVIEWLAAASWSGGKVGMFGASWPGLIQLVAAMAKPPSLAAIFPSVPNFPDLYRIFRPGGVYAKGAAVTMRRTLVGLSEEKGKGQAAGQPARPAAVRVVGPARVDEDRDGALRTAARAAHGAASFSGYIDDILNHAVVKEAVAELGLGDIDRIINTLFFADSLDRALAGHDELRRKLLAAQWPQGDGYVRLARDWLDRINAASVPTYLWDGWQDPAPAERLLYFYNLSGPTRLTVGPWSHGAGEPNDPREDAHLTLMATELVRWFDFWLRGIRNGIDREPKVNYAVMQDEATWDWRSAETIPPAEAIATDFHFGPGSSASAGALGRKPRQDEGGADRYTADYALTSGNRTRLHDATGGGPILYSDLGPNDARALTYTTAPLEQDLRFAGFPIVTMHVSSTARDPSFVVYLEEVDREGRSTLVTQGFIRASHRTPWEPPWSTNGTPWTSSLAKDVAAAAPLTDGPAEIRFALNPAANRFDAGHRLRVTIALADEGTVWVIPESPRPVITMHRDRRRPSRLTLPVLPAENAPR